MLKRAILLIGIICSMFFFISQGAGAAVDCTGKKCNIESVEFQIPVSEVTGTSKMSSGSLNGSNTAGAVNFFLATVMQKMMIALGILSLVIMVVGTGYMIFYAGNDSNLSKGKSMFIGGIVSLVVALSSYYLISTIRYIIYTGT